MSYATDPHSIKNEIKDTLAVSIPLVSSQIIYSCSGFIGTAMIARLGKDALAASILVTMIWISLSVLFFGMLNAISVLVSHQYGAKNNKAISEIMGQSFILGLVVTVLMIAILSTMPLFLRFTTQQPKEVLHLARIYMHSMFWMIPALIVLIINEQFLAGVNRAKMVLRISMIVVPIEIPLIYILIFGKFGLPAFGIAGISYGFAITYTITAIFLSWYLLKSKQYRHFAIFSRLKSISWHWQKELFLVGLPMGLMHVIEISAFTVATFWISQFGTTMLAAHQIVMQYFWMTVTMIFAMSQAVTIRVGHSVGRQDARGVQYAAYIGMLLNFAIMIFIALAFYFIPTLFLRLDLNLQDPANAALIKDASALLGISGILMLFDNFRLIMFGALRGLKDTRFPMYASFLSFWVVGLSCAYLLSFVYHFSGNGIWWGLTIGIASGAVIVYIRLRWLLKRVDLNKLMKV